MRIESIILSDIFEINPKKITVLVGPNNVGKSQFLKDIHNRLIKSNNWNPKIIQNIEFIKPTTFEKLTAGLYQNPHTGNSLLLNFDGLDSTLLTGTTGTLNHQTIEQYDGTPLANFFEQLGKFHVAHLDAQSKLQIATQRNVIKIGTPPPNLSQILLMDKTGAKKELEDTFRNIFNREIKLAAEPADISFRITEKFEGEEPSELNEKYDYFKNYETLNDQGDGYKSFVGVALSILLCRQRIILLDEPEAFLHPIQARGLGRWISEYLNELDAQIIIATHNANFLAGILSGNNQVDVFRLNRKGNNTSFSQITSTSITNLTQSPILSSQSVHEAIFSEGVVVCESDTDRIFYQKVFQKEHFVNNILFIHSHGKHLIKDIVDLLKKVTVSVSTIIDIDILNSKDDFKKLLSAFMDDIPPNYLEDQEKIMNFINGSSEKEILEKCKNEVKELIEQLDQEEHTLAGFRGALSRIESGGTSWKIIKEGGIDAMDLSIKECAKELLDSLKNHGIFIVPTGELESWIKSNRKKNKWIVPALTEIDNGKCPSNLKSFSKEVIDYLEP
ncbi:MAG: ATP-binding protein [Nitrosopumilus sp.]|nr:ATP-binding protein [Nitrosopumilus sp.]MDH3852874.1 ATP-binding protein [Nitrosopumilus sp.]